MLPSRQVTRRKLLQIGGQSFLGLNAARMLAASERSGEYAARAKSVIFLYQFGGPSHLETFDPKPEAPSEVRGQFGTIATRVPGLEISDRLPEMAKVMDKVTLVRTVHHTMKNHNSASYYALTGHAPPVDDIRLRDSLELFPAYGSVVDRLLGSPPQLPGFVSYPYTIRDGEITPGQHASFLGKRHDPLLVLADPNQPQFSLPELSLPTSLSPDRLANRRALQDLVNSQTRLAQDATARGVDEFYERTLSMLESPEVRRAFDLSAEPETVRQKYGRTSYGQGCLLARRLVESGVRFVNVYYSESIGGRTLSGGWDTHGFDNTRMYPILEKYHLPLTDQTLPTLLIDLDERGLLDETLVVWMGEFGRTPRLNANISRDHWPGCYTVLLAGGGVPRGFVYGRSDRFAAYPDRDPVLLDDLAATIFALVGIDPKTEFMNRLNRPVPVSSGRVVEGLLA